MVLQLRTVNQLVILHILLLAIGEYRKGINFGYQTFNYNSDLSHLSASQ